MLTHDDPVARAGIQPKFSIGAMRAVSRSSAAVFHDSSRFAAGTRIAPATGDLPGRVGDQLPHARVGSRSSLRSRSKASCRRSSSKPVSALLDRNDLGTVPELVQVLRPHLQHLPALFDELRPVVGAAQRILTACASCASMTASPTPKRSASSVRAIALKPWPVISSFGKSADTARAARSSPAATAARHAPLRSTSPASCAWCAQRDAPLRRVEVEFGPLGLTQFAWPHEH